MLAAAGVIGWAVTRVPASAPPAAVQVRTTTVPVTRGDVAARVQVAGVLGFDKAYTIVNQLPGGVLTAVSAPGTAVVRGADLYAVAGVPAVLLYGTTPAYRDLAAGMTDGADVLQLEQNLVALGVDPQHAHHGRPALQRRHGDRDPPLAGGSRSAGGAADRAARARAGRLPARRASASGEVLAEVGASVGPGEPVLSATTTARVVRVALTAGRQNTVHPGDPVQVTVPGLAQPVAGTVREIGTVATRRPGEGAGTGDGTDGHHRDAAGRRARARPGTGTGGDHRCERTTTSC